jgi:flagellar protein FlaF
MMFRGSYTEIMEESADVCRARERAAFDRAIDLMESADAADAPAGKLSEAVRFVQRLWSVLIDDLTHPENDLPEALRADLVSIGLWTLRQSDRILRGDAHGFDGLIFVNAKIRDGLK